MCSLMLLRNRTTIFEYRKGKLTGVTASRSVSGILAGSNFSFDTVLASDTNASRERKSILATEQLRSLTRFVTVLAGNGKCISPLPKQRRNSEEMWVYEWFSQPEDGRPKQKNLRSRLRLVACALWARTQKKEDAVGGWGTRALVGCVRVQACTCAGWSGALKKRKKKALRGWIRDGNLNVRCLSQTISAASLQFKIDHMTSETPVRFWRLYRVGESGRAVFGVSVFQSQDSFFGGQNSPFKCWRLFKKKKSRQQADSRLKNLRELSATIPAVTSPSTDLLIKKKSPWQTTGRAPGSAGACWASSSRSLSSW